MGALKLLKSGFDRQIDVVECLKCSATICLTVDTKEKKIITVDGEPFTGMDTIQCPICLSYHRYLFD